MIKILTMNEALATVRESLVISDQQVGELNDLLLDQLFQYNAGERKDCICRLYSSLVGDDKVLLRILAVKLQAAGWDAVYTPAHEPFIAVTLTKAL